MPLLRFFALALNTALWLVVAGSAALWWLPQRMGSLHPVSPSWGAICLIAAWAMMLNHLPRLGWRKFLQQKHIEAKLVALGIVSAFFCIGFWSQSQ